jgi:hypothetical protein
MTAGTIRPRTIKGERNMSNELLTVGQGATICLWSDRKAYTVIRRTRTRAWLQRDRATLINGLGSGEPDALQFAPGGFMGHTSGQQRYAYSPDPEGRVEVASMRKDGSWRMCGTGSRVIAGRHEHYDYNF